MASPADPSHPLTPPAEQTQSSHPTSQPPTQSQNTSTPGPNSSSSTNQTSTARAEVLLAEPLTSLDDNGLSKRPRDHRLIHLLLASYGITAYQERVPLQLMDFAYRYTSNLLTDAVHIQSEGYDHADGGASNTGKGRGGGKGGNRNNTANSEDGDLSLQALRFAIGSRMNYQMTGSLPKEFLKSLADERNRVSLAAHMRSGERGGATVGGVQLPHERFCLTASGWGLKDEWESEGEESVDDEAGENGVNGNGLGGHRGDSLMMDGPGDEQMDEDMDEDGVGNMEDVFGPSGDGGDAGDDEEMQDM